jgi:hypothetical protein
MTDYEFERRAFRRGVRVGVLQTLALVSAALVICLHLFTDSPGATTAVVVFAVSLVAVCALAWAETFPNNSALDSRVARDLIFTCGTACLAVFAYGAAVQIVGWP